MTQWCCPNYLDVAEGNPDEEKIGAFGVGERELNFA